MGVGKMGQMTGKTGVGQMGVIRLNTIAILNQQRCQNALSIVFESVST